MAVSKGTVTGYAYNSTSDSRAVTVDAGSSMVVVFAKSRFSQGNITGITLGGSALTKLVSFDNGASESAIEVWYIVSPSTGTPTLAISQTSSRGYVIEVVPVSGSHLTTPFRSQGANSWKTSSGNTGTSASCSLTSATGDLCLDGISINASTDVTSLTDNQTQDQNLRESGQGCRGGGQHASGAATVSMTWTIAPAKTFNQVALSIQPAPAATATPTLTLLGVGS